MKYTCNPETSVKFHAISDLRREASIQINIFCLSFRAENGIKMSFSQTTIVPKF